jgi:RHS repeat-associated protein
VSTNTTKIPSQWTTWLANNATNRYQITNTIYDLPAPSIISPWLIQNTSTLRNRVSYTTITPGQKGSTLVYATYYNYDIAGNVSTLLQDYGATSPMGAANQEYKRVDYNYDLISGKVNSVAYQSGKPDAFMHFYQYDAENRLTDVYSSADSVTVEHEAHYSYYLHGPLARSLIGANQVQGMDYAYTLQGWLKSVNGTTLNPLNDMGQDGNTAVQSQQYIGRDAYGYSLQYFEGDYYPIVGGLFLTGAKTALGTTNYKGLYNGNISSMAVNIGVLNDPKLYNYKYDQLNRITGMDVFNGTNTGLNLWSTTLTATNDYQERAAYDPNGNLTQYLRNGYGSTQIMDSITYRYNFDAQGRLINNRLDHIRDRTNNVDNSPNYPNDPDDQAVGNYKYDSAGNLIFDGQKGISPIVWSVYGKMLSVVKGSTTINYQYDAAGNRIGKNVGTANNWYVRDAQGNILSAYGGTGMVLQEQHLYGSSRLGMISNPAAIAGTAQYLDNLGGGTIYTFTRGNKLFELTNHLGNVWVTISDKKYGTPVSGIPSQVSYYTADVKSAQDYYPFGMEMPGRQYNYNYAYSFNDKRDDKDANYGWQDYGMREYDRRLGRFFSVDPLIKRFPMLSPFQYASNNPIFNIDLDGLEGASWWTQFWHDPVATIMYGTTWDDVNDRAEEFNRNVNPVGIVTYNGYQLTTGRDLGTGQKGSRVDAFGNLVILSIFHGAGVRATAPNGAAALEKQMAKNSMAATNKPAIAAHGNADEATATSTATATNKPASKFLGGAKGKLFSKQQILESNHAPTMNSFEIAGFKISYNKASAFQMIYEEHRGFISTGNGSFAQEFRNKEADLMKQGKFMDAFELTTNEIRAEFGNKYDEAIGQAREYYRKNIVPQLQKQLSQKAKSTPTP